MANLLTVSYWFNLRPEPLSGLGLKIVLGGAVLLLILAVIAGLIKKRWGKSLYAGLWSGWYYFLLTDAIIGLLLAFFGYEMVPFLSSRFWYLLWAAGALVWLYFLCRLAARIPRRKAQLEKEKAFRKYLP